jgi:hypothetical protein
MKRINILAAGIRYSVGDRELDDLQHEIAAALKSGEPYWLEVNEGEGTPRRALLLITAGMNLVLVPIPEPHQDVQDTTDQLPPAPAR